MNVKIFAFLLVLTSAFSAAAEQGCPPGQYPIGGQGVAACAPIPQGGSGQQDPKPIGKWIKTWGSVAHDPKNGILGVSLGKLSKREAEKDALNKCLEGGGASCKVWESYQNQCAAIAGPQKDGRDVPGAPYFARGPSLEDVENRAKDGCASASGFRCGVLYSACSEPIFKNY
ncbi:DUF4189 domain-containing protein [Xanthomonas sp. NCPPB 1067]|uniref:DUF4189 domain-containing protein n=1 Tax=Xanthomonas sp. NCPPB 1067 TaxID=487524 RepID=UPI001E2E649F|nr:DUF4189 domain-containing protein [Xanthomonas sp. NCPPB 1067]MCC4589505.1 DUF4189 domain-containing protein [Xanthomonas sp. NCPPB 1067]